MIFPRVAIKLQQTQPVLVTEGISILSWEHRAKMQIPPCPYTHKSLGFPNPRCLQRHPHTGTKHSPEHFLQSHYGYNTGRKMTANPTEDGGPRRKLGSHVPEHNVHPVGGILPHSRNALRSSVSAIATPTSRHILSTYSCSKHLCALIHVIPPPSRQVLLLASPSFQRGNQAPERLSKALKVKVALLGGVRAGFGPGL